MRPGTTSASMSRPGWRCLHWARQRSSRPAACTSRPGRTVTTRRGACRSSASPTARSSSRRTAGDVLDDRDDATAFAGRSEGRLPDDRDRAACPAGQCLGGRSEVAIGEVPQTDGAHADHRRGRRGPDQCGRRSVLHDLDLDALRAFRWPPPWNRRAAPRSRPSPTCAPGPPGRRRPDRWHTPAGSEHHGTRPRRRPTTRPAVPRPIRRHR